MSEEIRISLLGLEEDFVAVSFATPSTGYILDTAGRLYRTDDGGMSWRKVLQVDRHLYFNHLSAPEPDVVFVASNFVLMRTLDGGQSWEMLSKATNADPTQSRL